MNRPNQTKPEVLTPEETDAEKNVFHKNKDRLQSLRAAGWGRQSMSASPPTVRRYNFRKSTISNRSASPPSGGSYNLRKSSMYASFDKYFENSPYENNNVYQRKPSSSMRNNLEQLNSILKQRRKNLPTQDVPRKVTFNEECLVVEVYSPTVATGRYIYKKETLILSPVRKQKARRLSIKPENFA